MKDLVVLITACGAQFAPGLVACLKDNGERNIRLVGVDMEYDYSLLDLYDCVYEIPKVTEDGYVDAILDVCKTESVDVLLPVMSAELLMLLDRKEDFDRIGTKLAINDRDSITICTNKKMLYDYMEIFGIETPKFYPVRNASDLARACKYVGYPEYPVCVKATQLSGSRGVRIIDPAKSRFDILFGEKPNSLYTTLEDLQATLNERPDMPEMMAMEYLPGAEGSLDLIAEKGKILYYGYRESNVNLASIPQVATFVENEEAYKIAEKIISKLELTGCADLDFRYNRDGRPVLMEINPRTAATMQIFKEGGLNLPYLRIKQVLGEELPPVHVTYGVKMHRRYLEMFAR